MVAMTTNVNASEQWDYPIPRELLTHLSQRQIKNIRQPAWKIIAEAYRFCRDNEPSGLVVPKPIETMHTHNSRFNDARPMALRELLVAKLFKHLSEKQLNEEFQPGEAAALLSAIHNHPVNPETIHKKSGPLRVALKTSRIVGTTHLYYVRDIIQKRVRRPKNMKIDPALRPKFSGTRPVRKTKTIKTPRRSEPKE